jgi:hypothetical protein
MVRLRKSDGTVEVVDAPVVEICSTDGLLFRLLFNDGDRLVLYEPGDAMFERYLKSAGMQAAPAISIKD